MECSPTWRDLAWRMLRQKRGKRGFRWGPTHCGWQTAQGPLLEYDLKVVRLDNLMGKRSTYRGWSRIAAATRYNTFRASIARRVADNSEGVGVPGDGIFRPSRLIMKSWSRGRISRVVTVIASPSDSFAVFTLDIDLHIVGRCARDHIVETVGPIGDCGMGVWPIVYLCRRHPGVR